MLLMRRTEAYSLPAKLFRGLSDESRLAILESLRQGPLAVGRIVEITGLSQSNTSNHLRCLSDCGLVSAEQRGRSIHYSLSDQRIRALLQIADDLLAEVGRRVYACTNYSDAAEPRSTANLGRKRQRGRRS